MDKRKSTYDSPSVEDENNGIRRSTRKKTPSKHTQFVREFIAKTTPQKRLSHNAELNGDTDMATPLDEFGSTDENHYACAVSLFNNVTDIHGSEMFGLFTPKKRDGMRKKAENTPTTPTSALKTMSLYTPKNTTKHTPIIPLRTMSLNSPDRPTMARGTALGALKNTNLTPADTRNKNKQFLQKHVQKSIEELDSESESEAESSADEHSDYEGQDTSESSESSGDGDDDDATNSDDEDKTKQVAKNRKAVQKIVDLPTTRSSARSRSKKKMTSDDFIPDSDNYFIAASNKKSKTSDHTLDQLKSSRLQHDELFNLLNSINSSKEHHRRIREMLTDYRQYFDRWWLEIQKGYNIIVYGTGSKQKLLHEFCETRLSDKPLIVVNGFFPSLTTKDILNSIKVQLLDININSRNEHEIVDVIASALDTMPNAHVFLVINNIDGVMLRKTKDQHIISRLAKVQRVHLIASIDHINAPLMWDQTCMDNFNFVWYDCTTMMPYKNETAFENSVFFQSSGELDLAAMNNVFRSLTANARGIYMILVKHQLTNDKDLNYQGMTFKELYQKCREHFLVNSDSTLRTQLIEFVDHKMAKIKRSHDATELVSIPISAHILLLFSQQQIE